MASFRHGGYKHTVKIRFKNQRRDSYLLGSFSSWLSCLQSDLILASSSTACFCSTWLPCFRGNRIKFPSTWSSSASFMEVSPSFCLFLGRTGWMSGSLLWFRSAEGSRHAFCGSTCGLESNNGSLSSSSSFIECPSIAGGGGRSRFWMRLSLVPAAGLSSKMGFSRAPRPFPESTLRRGEL